VTGKISHDSTIFLLSFATPLYVIKTVWLRRHDRRPAIEEVHCFMLDRYPIDDVGVACVPIRRFQTAAVAARWWQ
jgi:hypothetical protein